jgi:hypothetical protein
VDTTDVALARARGHADAGCTRAGRRSPVGSDARRGFGHVTITVVSYDIAVWVGEQPADDEAAKAQYEALSARDRAESDPPDSRLIDYVTALTQRFPDLTDLDDDEVDDSPWADGPLIDNVDGTFFYFALTYSGIHEALPFVAQTAKAHGLVCFDPQEDRLVVAAEPSRPREPLRKLADRVEREMLESVGFKRSRGFGRMAVAPGIEGVFSVMTASGSRAPLALRARVGVVLGPYERELEDLLEHPSGFGATIITDLGSLVPKEDGHWYEDVWDEASIRALLDRFRRDLQTVGLPWMRGFTDRSTLAAYLREDDHLHGKCVLVLVYRDLGLVESALTLLAEEKAARYGQEFEMRDWSRLTEKLRPTLLRLARQSTD